VRWSSGGRPGVFAPRRATSRAELDRADALAERPATGDDPSEAEQVGRALRLLRHDDQPAAALALLEQELGRFPDGPLLEEALGAAIEAAARVRPLRAAELGALYLARFPSGRFRAAAERARAVEGR
jgi:hypothetical protein